MPVYDYKCASHGVFHELATMADSGKPAPCPKCGASSARIIMIPPAVLDMSPAARSAQGRNEKARHQPVISSVDSRAEAADRARHKHRSGCGCNDRGSQSALKQQVVFLPDGSKVFPSQRPWMISH